MFLLDRFKGHKSVEFTESEGLGPILETVEGFKDRTFKVRTRGIRASHVPVEEVKRFIQEELPGYYSYTSRIETYYMPARGSTCTCGDQRMGRIEPPHESVQSV